MARPVSFDREQVLERATAVFWERGFCETSMSQLVDATRLQPGSLYAAFRSKEGLFLEALDHYAALYDKAYAWNWVLCAILIAAAITGILLAFTWNVRTHEKK